MRLTISLRLSAIFGLLTALVLTLFGLYVYTQMRSDLTAAVDQGLQSRARLIAGAIPRLSRGPVTDTGVYGQPDEAFAQVLGASGAVVDTSGNIRGFLLLGRRQLDSVTEAAFFTRRLPGFDDPIRVFATRNSVGGESDFTVVGETLGDTNDAARQLARHYLTGALATLAGVVLLGWLLVRAALRPVERMRRQADVVSLDEGTGPLAVPRASDELSRLAGTLNSMLDRLRRAHARERRFIDYASHELRTPLTALRVELDLALDRPRSASELTSAVSSAGEEVGRLIRLAEDLLTLAAAGRGAAALHRTDVRLSGLIESAVDAFGRRAGSRQVSITASTDDATASLDRALLRQALGNLLDNALRHAPAGSSIVVQACRRGDRVVITVADHGAGFPQQFIDRAFEPFARADSESSGSGLGLAIVDAVARAHGGTAVAGNSPGGGAYVTIELAAPPAALAGADGGGAGRAGL
jgi:signal transduction histidine kinase